MTIIVQNDFIHALKMHNYQRRTLEKESVGISLNFSTTRDPCLIPLKEHKKQQKKEDKLMLKENWDVIQNIN